MKIIIETIPHQDQRYPTVGDWQWTYGLRDEHTLKIRVSKLSDWRYEALVALHEAIEAILGLNAGVSELELDHFDIQYEHQREPGDTSEPGDDPLCPIHRQHRIATAIETLLAIELGVDWQAYEDEIHNLSNHS